LIADKNSSAARAAWQVDPLPIEYATAVTANHH